MILPGLKYFGREVERLKSEDDYNKVLLSRSRESAEKPQSYDVANSTENPKETVRSQELGPREAGKSENDTVVEGESPANNIVVEGESPAHDKSPVGHTESKNKSDSHSL